MKKIFLAPIIFLLVFTSANAQVENQQTIDSVQRKIMKDSLQISEEVTSQIFSIRNAMTAGIIALRTDATLQSPDISSQIISVRNAANSGIRQILGERKYEQYTKMIRRWVSRRTNRNTDPLAESN